MRSVMLKFSSLKEDQSLRPHLPPQYSQAGGALATNKGYGDMKVDTLTHARPSKPIVEFLYISIIEPCAGLHLGWTRKNFADNIRCSIKAARGQWSCQCQIADQ